MHDYDMSTIDWIHTECRKILSISSELTTVHLQTVRLTPLHNMVS